MPLPPRNALFFPPTSAQHLTPYLPPSPPPPPPHPHPHPHPPPTSKPHVTLTFATSLDSCLSLSPGMQTTLSGPQSKAMTHYLRSQHDAILIGSGTAIADDPSLNCRIRGVGGYGGVGLEGQPRPVVVDPRGRWDVSVQSKVVELASEGRGKGVWVLSEKGAVGPEKKMIVESGGGRVLEVESMGGKMAWGEILEILAREGIHSVMIEGGGAVINDLLSRENMGLVDSVIVTIAPVWLGKGGVQVYPDAREEEGRRVPVNRLKNVKWVPLGEDVVLCGHPMTMETVALSQISA